MDIFIWFCRFYGCPKSKQTHTRTYLLDLFIHPPTQFSHWFAHIHSKMPSFYRSCHVSLITWVYVSLICLTLMTLNWCLPSSHHLVSARCVCRSRRSLCIFRLMFFIFVSPSASTPHCLTRICRNWQSAVGNLLALSLLWSPTCWCACMFECPPVSLPTSRRFISLTVDTIRFRRVNVYVCYFACRFQAALWGNVVNLARSIAWCWRLKWECLKKSLNNHKVLSFDLDLI